MKLTIEKLTELEHAISDAVGFLTDNSCSDPDCCGGPYYTRKEYNEARNTLKKYGIEVEE